MAKRKAPKKKNTKQEHLTPSQEAFCQAYVLMGFNGTAAYRQAFPKTKDSLDDTVAAMASKLLATAKIAQRVAVLKIKASAVAEKQFEVTAEKIIQELAAVAFQNAGDYFEWGTIERVVRRKNKETGRYEEVLDQNGKQIVESVPYARIKPSAELTKIQKKAIVTVSETVSRTGDRVIEAKVADKLSALKLLGQYKGLFKEKVEHTGKDGGPIQTNANVTLPDLKKVTDPRDALRAFEMFRMGMLGQTTPASKAN